MKKHNIFFMVLLIFSLVFLLNAVSAAGTVNIDNTTSGGIKKAINNGTNVIILDGKNYSGSNNTALAINNTTDLTIKSSDPNNKAFINANGNRFISNKGNLTLINLIIINGKTGSYGGAIYNMANLNVINCTFINNSAYEDGYGGGAIYNLGANCNISGSTFINNSAKLGSGGAIYNIANENNGMISNCNVTDSIFLNNSANIGGSISNSGALVFDWDTFTSYNIYSNCNISNSNFTKSISDYGGAIVNNDANCNISDSNFTNNSASQEGGAIFNTIDSRMIVVNSNFTNNSANSYGGAIHNRGTFSEDFNGNIHVIYSYCNVTDSIFVNNSVNSVNSKGGAIYNDYGIMNVSSSEFINNSATGINSRGGAIFNQVNGSMKLSNNTMSSNSATIANVIYNNGSMGVLNLTFLNNLTLKVENNTTVILNASLTDDMGNPVTGQNISFFVNNTFITSVTSNEGYTNVLYLVNQVPASRVPVYGSYNGIGTFDINIRNGTLSIADIRTINETSINGNIVIAKNKYKFNETVKGKINIANTGNHTAINVIVKITLPKGFKLDLKSIKVSKGTFNPNTSLWTIGDLSTNEKVAMNFKGKFEKIGNYTFSILATGANFKQVTDSDITEVLSKKKDKNDTNKTKKNKKIPNPNVSKAGIAMEKTGVPIFALALVLIFSICLPLKRRK
ncbi:MAG: hypothetical protein ACRC1M_06910 [Methanobacteriaceae archaeon]